MSEADLPRPRCPECPVDGDYSVMPVRKLKTSLAGPRGVYDADGEYHPPIDPNTVTTTYRCTNGHEWTRKTPADLNATEKRAARREAKKRGVLDTDGFGR